MQYKIPGYDTWKLASPEDEYGPEPSDKNVQDAIRMVLADTELLRAFLEVEDLMEKFLKLHEDRITMLAEKIMYEESQNNY